MFTQNVDESDEEFNTQRDGESDEEFIIRMLKKQTRLAREIKQLRLRERPDAAAIAKLKLRHKETVNILISKLYIPLKQALEGLDQRFHKDGVQYTEMVHDFMRKLQDGRVVRIFETLAEFHQFVATVLMNQFRNHLRMQKTHRKHQESGLAAIAEHKQRYFEDRYTISYLDALDQIEQWEQSEDENLQLLAQAMKLHYIAGEKWGVIALELGISDERLAKVRLTQLREQAAKEFHKRE